jgi:hypothetical protein
MLGAAAGANLGVNNFAGLAGARPAMQQVCLAAGSTS